MEKQPVCYFNHYLVLVFSIVKITEVKSEPFFITKRRSPLFPDTVVKEYRKRSHSNTRQGVALCNNVLRTHKTPKSLGAHETDYGTLS